jgi:ubiquinone/menaquinone biosynthesis C-methylase UbiE
MRQHMFERLENYRKYAIPWIIDAIGPISGKSILEVGCGTGSTTVALAEQGANVVAADEHDGSLRVAAERLDCYGLKATLVHKDAKALFSSFTDEHAMGGLSSVAV